MAEDDGVRLADGSVAVVRRAPFSDNPIVGARGQRTQQRILDAALRAFGETGYHACSIDRITRLARCSRVAFYQYFASKEDLFRQLAGQVARQVSASTEALDPVGADQAGWDALRAWVARYAEIYARYEAVFSAIETDEVLSAVAGRTGEETVARVRSRLATTSLPPRQLDPVIRLLLECLYHTLDVVGVLRFAAPDSYSDERVEVALTDVVHRTLFGTRPGLNVHDPTEAAPPALAFAPATLATLETLATLRQGREAGDADSSENGAYAALLATGHDVFVERGFHNTRVDDLVSAAGVSHGAFYRYFRNKEQLARILTAQAMLGISATFVEIPDVATINGASGAGVLRRWLRRYNAVQAREAAMLRVWIDAALQHPALREESAPPLDWGRRRMARYLRGRGFGDPETDAVVMVALFGVFGARPRTATEVEAAALVIERGLLGAG